MGIWQSYRMRLRRKRAKIRAFRKHFSLRLVADRTAQTGFPSEDGSLSGGADHQLLLESDTGSPACYSLV